MRAGTQNFRFSNTVNESLEDKGSFFEILHFEGALTAFRSHGRDKNSGIVSYQDSPQPVEVTESSLDFVLERIGCHFIDCIVLGEKTFLYNFGSV